MTPEKLLRHVKYNPLTTRLAPETSESAITTALIQLKRRDYALAAMGEGLVSGGGAFVLTPGGVLIAERSGKFYSFDPTIDPSRLTLSEIAVETNEAGFRAQASAEGYAIKPGRNVGYAGLGMRLHDLLLVEGGRRLLVSFTRWDDSEKCARLTFAIADLNSDARPPTAGPWRELYRTQPCLGLGPTKRKPFAGHQAGGRMVDLGNGRILFTVGDFKNDGEKRSLSTADPAVDYGKTHVLDIRTGDVARNYTTGHRNPQGLVVAADGSIWSTEHGPSGGDEVNRLVQGTDYGWPHVTLGMDCRGCDWQIEGRHDGYRKPAWSYLPSIGISNLIQLNGFDPLWDGDLLVASLRGASLRRLRLDGARVIYDEEIPIGSRIRDIAQAEDGRVVLWTDDGKLVFLEAERDASPAEAAILALSPPAQAAARECQVCHHLGPGAAPPGLISLWRVVGRDKASLPEAPYSDALRAAGGVWTRQALDMYLRSPATAIPGTSMAYDGLQEDALRREMLDLLERLK